jgi:anti-sigma regulatory factor (Ser/Thr protein kinase)
MDSRTFTAAFSEFDHMMAFVRESINKMVKVEKSNIKFEVAIEEVLVNIIKYGVTAPSGIIEIRCGLNGSEYFEVKIIDNGIPFDPLNAPGFDKPQNLHSQKIGGLGLHFIKNIADSLSYEYKDGKNQLTLKKKLPF